MLPAGLEVEAVVVVAAVAAQAVAAVALDEVPDGRQRLEAEVAAAAVLRLPRPAADLVQLLRRLRVLDEQAAGALLGAAQAAQAEVVGAALDQDRGERLRHHASGGRGCPCGRAVPAG